MKPFQNPKTGSGWLFMHSAWRSKKPGDTCPSVSGYDRMRSPPTSYCGRRLFDLDERVEKLYNDLFKKRISGNDVRFNTMEFVFADKGEIETKKQIRELLLSGSKPICGYTSTSIRGLHERVILYKE